MNWQQLSMLRICTSSTKKQRYVHSAVLFPCVFRKIFCAHLTHYIILKQEDGRVCDYIGAQPDISAKMRAILVDWLIEVHRKFELMPESLYLTVNIVDRFLSVKAVPRKELQLVGMGSMLIACKYEEIWAPEVASLSPQTESFKIELQDSIKAASV